MKQSVRVLLLAAALAVCGAGTPAMAQDGASAQGAEAGVKRVVFQVSDGSPDKWNLTLTNARNVLDRLGKDHVQVEIVAYGPGIEALRFESLLANRIGQAVQDGVRIVACQNTMKSKHLTADDMLPSIGYVPVGVIELIDREQAGWAYVRP